MNVLLIQPPDIREHVAGRSLFKANAPRVTSPCWDLICLHAYVLGHTRHFCELLDTRLFADVERDLNQAIRQAARPTLAVVYCQDNHLPEIKSLLSAMKREHPGVPIALCGPFPSEHPGHALSLDEADFVLAGDPEPILRNLLDYFDLPQRLAHTPGLVTRRHPDKSPCWHPNLNSLSLPDWRGIDWSPYRGSSESDTLTIQASLSRGNAGNDADRAASVTSQPLRVWPFESMIACMKKCSHFGISRILFNDSLGFWNLQRLTHWTEALLHVRNAQPWGFRSLPLELHAHMLEDLATIACTRLYLFLPSCDTEVLAPYGCPEAVTVAERTFRECKTHGIQPYLEFWVGGPEEPRGEAERIMRTVRLLGYPKVSLTAFPYNIGSPVYRTAPPEKRGATLEDITAWLRNPWTTERPVVGWRGERGMEYVEKLMDYLERNITRSPRRILQGWWEGAQKTDVVRFVEDKALSLLVRRKPQAAE